VRLRRFALPKAGGRPEEYEDASWPDVDDTVLSGSRIRVAVADGASESLLAGAWASRLAASACRFDPRALRRAVRSAAAAWPAETARWLEGRDAPWWQVEKLGRGAHATVLVVQIHEDLGWRAAAVGDSCLLQLSDGLVKRAFPVDSPAAFDNRPELVNSAAVQTCQPRHATGACQPGDRLLLATDALAMWLLGSPDLAAGLLVELEGPSAQTAFADWAQRAWHGGSLRNDDLTLLVIDV
jgi:hypothetical protein